MIGKVWPQVGMFARASLEDGTTVDASIISVEYGHVTEMVTESGREISSADAVLIIPLIPDPQVAMSVSDMTVDDAPLPVVTTE